LIDFFCGLAFLIRGIPGTLRHWASEWFEVLALPIRVLLHPRALGSELLSSGRDIISLGGGAARGTLATVLAFVWLVVWSPLLIARFLFFDLPHRARVFAAWNTPKRIAIAVFASVGLFAGLGIWGYYTFSERRAQFQRDIYWRMFYYYVDHAEIEKVEKSLAELQRLLPDNGTINERLNIVRTREAPANDSTMVRLLMRTWYREQRYDLAAKEAAKLIVDAPNDWEALCFLTNDAVVRRDMEAARRYISAMPRPQDASEQIHLWTVPYALKLFQNLRETKRYDETVEFVIHYFLPYLRAKDFEYSDPVVKLILLECYDHAMSQIDRRPQLTEYWQSLQRAGRYVLQAEGLKAADLARLGMSVESQLVYLQKFARLKYITEEKRIEDAAEVEGRLTEIWNEVLARDKTNPTGYLGLAHQRYRAGDPAGAVGQTNRGIEACGETPLLVAFKARYLCLADPQAGRAYLEWALKKVQLSPELCRDWHDVERAAGRRDRARIACEKALELEPELSWPYLELGKIYFELEEWSEAAAKLDHVRPQLMQDPIGCRIYVKALCECGAFNSVEQLRNEMLAGQHSIDVLVEAAKGLYQAGRYEEAARWARDALGRDNTNTVATLTLAECLAKLSEVGETDWDRDKVHEAIRNFRHVQQQHPKALLPANNIAWLELKALGQSDNAYESAAPLRAAEDKTAFPASFFETLGVIEVAKERYDEGRQLLERAVASGEPKASFYYHLALAYHGLNQHDKAEGALAYASRFVKSPREQAEYLEIAKTIRKGR
jgi:tetratricopeptide (TPR) repeat protein